MGFLFSDHVHRMFFTQRIFKNIQIIVKSGPCLYISDILWVMQHLVLCVQTYGD